MGVSPEPRITYPVRFGGRVEQRGETSDLVAMRRRSVAMAYDIVVPGHGTSKVNTLRLWPRGRARAHQPRAPSTSGNYTARRRARRTSPRTSRACCTRTTARAAGRELRLKQEYFFVSASLQDMLRAPPAPSTAPSSSWPDKVAIHLNDTHPAIGVAELMRLLMDEHGMAWDDGLGAVPADLFLHQPHADARGARDLACGDAERRAAAPSADHLSTSTHDFLASVRAALSRRRRACCAGSR